MKQPTLQTQYNLITEGKGNKFAFLREAKTKFPGYVPNSANFEQAVNILKTKNILNENYVDLKPINDWERKEESYEIAFKNFLKEEETKVKSNSKKVAKEVEETQESNYSNDDVKNLDNQIGQEVLNGIAFEARKHPDKTLDEIRAIVSKNLAKDKLYYLKNAAFGVEGIGYTEDIPGLKPSKSDQMQKVKLNENYLNDKGEYEKEDDDLSDDGLFYQFKQYWRDATDKESKKDLLSYYKTQWPTVWPIIKNYIKQPINEGLFSKNKKPKVDGTYTVEFIKGDGKGHAKVFQDPRVAKGYKDQVNSIAKDEIAIVYPTGKRPENLGDYSANVISVNESKKPSIDDHLTKIEKAGEIATLEAKINAVDEAMKKRQERIDMIGENEDLADLVNPVKLKEMQREIKVLEKQKNKLEKIYQKITGKKKQEVVGEVEDESEQLNEGEQYGKSPEEDNFLRKVKEENPEMLTRFISMVKNKGLEIAKEKYNEFDPEIISKNKEQSDSKENDKKLLISFSKFLPKKLPELWKKTMEKTGEGEDGAFYLLLGALINKYGDRYGVEKGNRIYTLITGFGLNDEKYADEIDEFWWNLVDEKYGKHVIEW